MPNEYVSKLLLRELSRPTVPVALRGAAAGCPGAPERPERPPLVAVLRDPGDLRQERRAQLLGSGLRDRRLRARHAQLRLLLERRVLGRGQREHARRLGGLVSGRHSSARHRAAGGLGESRAMSEP